MSAREEWTRRRALIAGLTALGGGAWLTAYLAARRERGEQRAAVIAVPGFDPGGRLVLIELSGGLDGLSAVVPFADDAYHRLRPTTRLAPDEVLRIDEGRGLHPSLAGMRARFERGELAIVEGAGYADPIYSHFRAFEVWHTARRAGRASGDGWIGRLRMAAFVADARSELCVHVGPHMPYSMACAARPALAFSEPSSLRWHGDAAAREMFLQAAGGPPPAEARERGDAAEVLDALRANLDTAQQAAARVREATGAYRPRVEYPSTELGRSLRTAAALLQSEVGTRVLSVVQGNYDTHGGTMKLKHARLLADLDEALEAFLSDLAGTEAGTRTTVLLFSEFGRRAAENESCGTDHGAAGPMFVVGPGVRGGLYGASPSLTELDGDGNLIHTVDFRRVYASVVEACFGVAHQRVLPERFAALPLLRI